MANEITITQNIAIENVGFSDKRTHSNKKFDQTTLGGMLPGYKKIGTSEETLTTTDVATLGWAWIKNLDAANYVDFGFTTAVYGIRCEAGEVALFRLVPGVTIYALANTAEVKTQIHIYED